jgi:hypothetical protein
VDLCGLKASDKSHVSLPAAEDMVDLAATMAGASFAKSASNELGKVSMSVSIGAALVSSVSTTIQSGSLAKGAYDLVSSGASMVAGVISAVVVSGGLTAISGGTGAPIAAAAGWYAGYQVASQVSSFMDALGERIFKD